MVIDLLIFLCARIKASYELELWAIFENPETHSVLTEICLGKTLTGGTFLTSEVLKFDPSSERWRISVVHRNNEGTSEIDIKMTSKEILIMII